MFWSGWYCQVISAFTCVQLGNRFQIILHFLILFIYYCLLPICRVGNMFPHNFILDLFPHVLSHPLYSLLSHPLYSLLYLIITCYFTFPFIHYLFYSYMFFHIPFIHYCILVLHVLSLYFYSSLYLIPPCFFHIPFIHYCIWFPHVVSLPLYSLLILFPHWFHIPFIHYCIWFPHVISHPLYSLLILFPHVLSHPLPFFYSHIFLSFPLFFTFNSFPFSPSQTTHWI